MSNLKKICRRYIISIRDFVVFLSLPLLIAISILVVPRYSFSEEIKQSIDEYSKENILSFTRSLINNSEYYRAFQELNRMDSYYKNFLSPGELLVTGNFLLYKGGRYEFILNQKYSGDDMELISMMQLYKIDASIGLMDYGKADSILQQQEIDKEPTLGNFFFKRRLFAYIMHKRADDDKEYKAIKDYRDFSKYKELLEYSKSDFHNLKSLYLAAALGVVPGMGHIYSGQTGTGITALIVISINAAISYYAFRTGNKPIGIFVGAIGTFFYGGSILGGYYSAGNYNNSILNSHHNRLVNVLKFDEDHDYLYKEYGLGRYDKK